jgi:hypothetical protein
MKEEEEETVVHPSRAIIHTVVSMMKITASLIQLKTK